MRRWLTKRLHPIQLWFTTQLANVLAETAELHFVLFTACVLLGLPAMLGFGLHLFWTNHLGLTALLLILATGMALTWVEIRRGRSARTLYRLDAVLFILLLLSLQRLGGEGGSMALWLLTFPMVTLFLVGIRESILWNSLLFLGMAGQFWFAPARLGVFAYPQMFRVRLVTVYFVIWIMTSWFEFLRQHYRQGMEAGHRKLLEAERRVAQEQYQAQKLESLGSLAGGVAHDFNNMLGGIIGYMDLLLPTETDPKRQKYLQAVLAAATRSAELTQKLLAFGRRGKNLLESIQLEGLALDCLDIIRPSLSPNVQVRLEMAGCPPVDGDPAQLHQVVLNLCINAMEAMPDGGTLTLRAGLRPGAVQELEFSVSDTGQGIPELIRERIFEPFFTTKLPAGSGTGLGLSTAYGIIQAHGGSLSLDSPTGQGSRFRIHLPVGILPAPQAQAPATAAPGEGAVLLVEDEPILRDFGVAALESLGYRVTTASDGVEAIAAFEREHAQLAAVLLDLKMPRMGGSAAFAELRRINPRVPVIVCTGYGENEEVQELLTRGAAGMLAKPYHVAALAAKLRQVFEPNSRSRRST